MLPVARRVGLAGGECAGRRNPIGRAGTRRSLYGARGTSPDARALTGVDHPTAEDMRGGAVRTTLVEKNSVARGGTRGLVPTPHQEGCSDVRVQDLEPFRDPARELDRLMSIAASGTRAPLGMPLDVYRDDDNTILSTSTCPASSLQHRSDRRLRRLDDPGRAHPRLPGEPASHCCRAIPGVVRPATLPRRGRGLREPHRRLHRRCAARDDSRVTPDPAPQSRDHPCDWHWPHHLRKHRRTG